VATALPVCVAVGLAVSCLPIRAADVPSGAAAGGHEQQGQRWKAVLHHLQWSLPPASSASFQFVPIQTADR